MPRPNDRKPDQLRPLSFERGYTRSAPGSVLVRMGRTTVLCTCCVEPKVPDFLVGKGKGWLTAEYGMLPGSTSTRKPRDKGGKVDGRSVELDVGRWEEIFQSFPELNDVHVIVSNGAATLEVEGEFGGFSTWGEFFNVQNGSGGLDMHIRYGELGSVFAVEKPSHLTGINTLSVQFFDRRGAAALKVFFNFGGKPTPQRLAQFESLREYFRRT